MLPRVPTSLPGLAAFHWVRQVHRADHFRAVWRWAWRASSADERALTVGLAVVGGLAAAGVVGGLGGGFAALARMARFGLAAGTEAALNGLIALACGAGLYGLGRIAWPRIRVLEARPGLLRFGPRQFAATRVRVVRLIRRTTTLSTWEPTLDMSIHTRHTTLEVHLVPHHGPSQRVWRVGGRAAGPAARWVRAMARAAGVPVEDAPLPRASS